MNYELIAPREHSSAMVQTLLNRGIPLEEIEHYLNTTDQDILPCHLLDNMRDGAKMLTQAIARNQNIYVQVDCDMDGYTSAALLINYLNRIAPHYTQNHVSYGVHKDKSHGIDTKAFDISKVSLIIAPDSSSNEFTLHKELNDAGAQILVIDHHEAEQVSQYACVINNQLCAYPNKTLSGVGVVYKFCSYLDELLHKNYANDFLDLVAMGMVADMMDLRNCETKHLINLGINNIKNPFLQKMVVMQDFSLGGEVTPEGISFYIAPYINAVTRSGTHEEKLLVFEAMLEYKANEEIPSTKRGHKGEFETRAEQACRVSGNVKTRQTTSRDRCLELARQMIEEYNMLKHKIIFLVFPKNVISNKSLNGLIANQLMSEYQRPVLVLSETFHDGESWYEGSARNYDKCEIKNLRELLLECPQTQYAEGHPSAFGFGIKVADAKAFIAWTDAALANCDFSAKYLVDFIYDNKNIDYTDICLLAKYKYLWGQKIEEPLVVIENVPVTKDNLALMKRNTVKISFDNISFITFNNEQAYLDMYAETGCVFVNIVGTCSINSYDNKP